MQGVLRVRVVEAKQLMKMDRVLGIGKSDPYAIVTVGSQEFRTKTIYNTVNPKWDFYCEVSKCMLKHFSLNTPRESKKDERRSVMILYKKEESHPGKILCVYCI